MQDVDEITPDPTRVHTFPQLRAELARLRVQARPGYKGHMSFETASQRSGIPKSTLHGYFRDRQIPSEQLDLLIKAMGVTDPEDVRSWANAWHRAKASTLPFSVDTIEGDGREPVGPAAVPQSSPAESAAEQRDETDAAVGTATGTPITSRRRSRALIVTGVIIAIAALVLIAFVAPRWMRSGPPPMSADLTPDIVFNDEFDSGQLDAHKWAPPTKSGLIEQANGRLNFVVTSAESATEVQAALHPLNVGPYQEVDFRISVPAYTQSGDGGVWLDVTEKGGRTSRIALGPSREGGASVYALFCSKPRCDVYQDFDQAKVFPFATGDDVAVRMTSRDGRLRLYIQDKLLQVGPEVDAPLTDFTLTLYAAGSEAWNITVDSLRLIR